MTADRPDARDDLTSLLVTWRTVTRPDGPWPGFPRTAACVLTVRLATVLLRERGHNAWALPVGVRFMDPIAAAASRDGVPWPEGAEGIRIVPGYTPSGDYETFWPGHLVTVVTTPEATHVIDLSTGQLQLPNRLAPSAIAVTASPEFPARRHAAAWRMADGCVYQIEDARGILGRSHRDCGDWQRTWRELYPTWKGAFGDVCVALAGADS